MTPSATLFVGSSVGILALLWACMVLAVKVAR